MKNILTIALFLAMITGAMAHHDIRKIKSELYTTPRLMNKYCIAEQPILNVMRPTLANATAKSGIGSTSSMMDFEPEDNTIGFSYSYSPIFPASISLNNTEDYLLWGIDIGFNFNKERYLVKGDTKDPIDPILYASMNWGVYFKYISISCGLGMSMSRNYSEYGKEINSNGVISIVVKNEFRYHFLQNPQSLDTFQLATATS